MLGRRIKYVTDLPQCTEAFDPSDWHEPEGCRDIPEHPEPLVFDLEQNLRNRMSGKSDAERDRERETKL